MSSYPQPILSGPPRRGRPPLRHGADPCSPRVARTPPRGRGGDCRLGPTHHPGAVGRRQPPAAPAGPSRSLPGHRNQKRIRFDICGPPAADHPREVPVGPPLRHLDVPPASGRLEEHGEGGHPVPLAPRSRGAAGYPAAVAGRPYVADQLLAPQSRQGAATSGSQPLISAAG